MCQESFVVSRSVDRYSFVIDANVLFHVRTRSNQPNDDPVERPMVLRRPNVEVDEEKMNSLMLLLLSTDLLLRNDEITMKLQRQVQKDLAEFHWN